MFIRRTQTRSTQAGETYFTHRLVRSVRTGASVRQQTLLNLGRHFEIDRPDWKLLCQRLGQLLNGQDALVPLACPEDVEIEAERIANQLLVREQRLTDSPDESIATSDSSVSAAAGDSGASAAADDALPFSGLQTVDVDSLELLRPRSVGVEHLGLWAMQQLGLIPLFEQLGINGPQRAALVGSIIGRMAAPGSERATYGWLCQRSALGELLDVDFESFSLMSLYRASDVLMRHRSAVEQHVFDQAMALFDLGTTVTLYDLTNTYFEGEAGRIPKAHRGRSKEKRSDCPLLTLGLVLDGSGFVRRSNVFDGNVSEGTTLATMLKDLGAPSDALVVMDRGIATEANLVWLREQGYRYLVVSRERHRQFDPDLATSLQSATKQTVHLQRVQDDTEVRVYCYSEARAAKEQAMTDTAARRFEQGLQALSDGLSRPRTRKGVDQLQRRIGRLIEKSRGIGQHYDIKVETDAEGKKATAIRWERQPIEGSQLTDPGVYCLRSNETRWDEQTLWRTYMMLTDLEAVFRSFKSELGLRPIYHHKQVRADGHLFITVLAYQLVQVIRRQLGVADQHDSWTTLRDTLSGQQRITATFRRSDGRTLHVRKATRAEPRQRAIYDQLGMNPAPGGIKKMII